MYSSRCMDEKWRLTQSDSKGKCHLLVQRRQFFLPISTLERNFPQSFHWITVPYNKKTLIASPQTHHDDSLRIFLCHLIWEDDIIIQGNSLSAIFVWSEEDVVNFRLILFNHWVDVRTPNVINNLHVFHLILYQNYFFFRNIKIWI
jgi:hypothetical protein